MRFLLVVLSVLLLSCSPGIVVQQEPMQYCPSAGTLLLNACCPGAPTTSISVSDDGNVWINCYCRSDRTGLVSMSLHSCTPENVKEWGCFMTHGCPRDWLWSLDTRCNRKKP